MGFAEAAQLAQNQTFVDRVTMALILAGGLVATEDKAQFADTQSAPLRNSLAVKVLQDPLTWGRIFAWLVMFHEGPRVVGAGVPDDLLVGIILWEWNAVSGAGPAIVPKP